jgi:hypothetical protein
VGFGVGGRNDGDVNAGRAGPSPPQPRRGGGGNNNSRARNGTDVGEERKPGLPPRPGPPRDLMDDDDGELAGSGWEALRPS